MYGCEIPSVCVFALSVLKYTHILIYIYSLSYKYSLVHLYVPRLIVFMLDGWIDNV